MSTTQYTWGLGRRKTSVARVRVASGAGGFLINGRPADEFFPNLQTRNRVLEPLKVTGAQGSYDIRCQLNGGGPMSGADAVVMGLARALMTINPTWEPLLREHKLLTRDSRKKERKHYGRRGARRGFQFSKR
jgi:small subunit ribosomal protein S9